MKTLFTTADVHPRDRFDYWYSVACASIVGHDSIPDCRKGFEGELQSAALADLTLVLCEHSPLTISHTARHAAQLRADVVFVRWQARGTSVLEQESREAVLEPGDLMLVDPRFPYRGRFEAGARSLVIKVPRRLIEARIGQIRHLTGCVIKPCNGESSLASGMLGMLPDYAESLSRAAAGIVMDQVLDLFAISLAQAIESRRPRLSSARSLVMMRVRAAIEARLPDPTLDAQAVAADAGVSVRYANAVLAEESTSIQRLIWARRLTRCHRALEDKSQAHRTVSEIAYGWGFSDMTHFGRKFREAYGLLPSEYRRLTMTTDRRTIGADASRAAAAKARTRYGPRNRRLFPGS